MATKSYLIGMAVGFPLGVLAVIFWLVYLELKYQAKRSKTRI